MIGYYFFLEFTLWYSRQYFTASDTFMMHLLVVLGLEWRGRWLDRAYDFDFKSSTKRNLFLSEGNHLHLPVS